MHLLSLNSTKLLLIISVSFWFAACSSGGGDGDGGGSSNVVLKGFIASSLLIDVDNDSDLDLLALPCCTDGRTDIPLFLNDGVGNFTIKAGAMPNRFLGPNGVTAQMKSEDFNNDGFLDVLAITTDLDYTYSEIQLFLGNGDGTFTDASAKIADRAFDDALGVPWIADFDKDGRLDFLITAFNPDPSIPGIYLQDSNGDFARAIDLNVINLTVSNSHVWVGDLDNDGDADIIPGVNTSGSGVAPEFYDRWLSYRNDSTPGNLSFSPIDNGETENDQFDLTTFLPSREKFAGALVDLNGDGYLDFYTFFGIKAFGPNNTSIYINDQTGKLVYDISMLNGLTPQYEHAVFDPLIADFDLNGRDDIFIPDHGFDAPPFPGFRNWLLLNTVTRLEDRTAASLSLTESFTHGSSVGDVNGDGYPDLFLNDSNGHSGFEGRLWINNGDGTFHESGSGI